jgi:amino acid adenylation domain-containing protein
MISNQKMTSTSGDSILSRFIERSTERPNSPAIFVGDRLYTYGELNGISSAVHALLRANHVRRGDRVGIFTENSIYTYASILGIMSCGACYVPLDYENPIERNRSIIADADIKVVLYAEKEYEARELSVSTGVECRQINDQVAAAHPSPLHAVDQSETDLCYLLFTSGTTGKPKGVPIYRRNLSAFLHMMLESGRYAFNSNDRFLQMFELTFDLSVFSFLIPLSVGASVYPIRRKRMAYLEVAETLEARDITIALMVPSVINYLKPYFGELHFPKLRYSLFCGEALYHETLCGWAQCVPSAKIENLYGPTEATVFCIRYEWRRGELPHPQGKGIVPIGKPMEGMDAFKTNASNLDEGELCLSGGQVTDGYWKNPVKTDEAFGTTDDGRTFYRTGDLCKNDDAGNFLYLGRIDSQVKIDGHRIELEEIEFHARAFRRDKQIVAAVVPSDAGLHSIILFIEGEENVKHGLEEYLKDHLPSYMIPKEIIPINLFPLNSNGKTDRKALIHKYLQTVNERST